MRPPALDSIISIPKGNTSIGIPSEGIIFSAMSFVTARSARSSAKWFPVFASSRKQVARARHEYSKEELANNHYP
jgi:hypothetical protein